MSKQIEINDEAFILDMDWARVFPVKVTGKSGKDYNARYTVKLDVTPGVRDELAFNGIAKPCPFSIPDDKLFSDDELYKDKLTAYQELIQRCDREQEHLKEHIEKLKHCKTLAQERVAALMKAENTKYKIGDTVWFISKSFYEDTGKVVEATIEKYDRGDFQNKPYYVKSKKADSDTAWCSAEHLYSSKEEAVTAIKAKLKAAYEAAVERAVADEPVQ